MVELLENVSKADAVSRFQSAIAKAGLTPPPIITLGAINRFPDDGGDNDNGWCVLNVNEDGTAGGVFGNWRDCSQQQWFHMPDGIEQPDAKRILLQEQMKLSRERFAAEKAKKQEFAEQKAKNLWANGEIVKKGHPYLVKKRIQSLGLRQHTSLLLVPLYENYQDYLDHPGRPLSLQLIGDDGNKKFLPGGKVAGCFHPIGIQADSDILYITEGYATGATVYEATGCPVIVAFNTGNLMAVSQKVKEQFPGKRIVIAADNDLNTEAKSGTNPGKKAATEVADALDIEYALCPVDSDYNDLFCQHEGEIKGIDVVREALCVTNKTDIYRQVVDKLNLKYAAIMLGSKCQVMSETYDYTLERPDTQFLSFSDFKKFRENETIPDTENPKKRICVADYWWKSPDRRSYEGVVFAPDEEIQGHYNLWKGLKIKEQPGDWSLFREHIRLIIADGNEEIFRWVLAWMARIVQDPGGQRPGAAIVLRGGQGAGKGTFVEYFSRLFGIHFLPIAHASQVVGRFNSHLKDKVLVFVDEGFWAGDKQAEGIIKNLVTERTLTIEQKGKDIISVKNNVNLVIASNNEWVIPAGSKERRFLVLDVAEHMIQDPAYFKPLHHQMENSGCEAMLYDLKRLDISGIKLGKIPRTKALADQQCNSMNNVEKFWMERLKEGTLAPEHKDWRAEILVNSLYFEFKEFASGLKDRHPATKESFGRNIAKVCPPVHRARVTDGEKRPWIYRYPTLEECRREFENATGMQGLIDWEEDL